MIRYIVQNVSDSGNVTHLWNKGVSHQRGSCVWVRDWQSHKFTTGAICDHYCSSQIFLMHSLVFFMVLSYRSNSTNQLGVTKGEHSLPLMTALHIWQWLTASYVVAKQNVSKDSLVFITVWDIFTYFCSKTATLIIKRTIFLLGSFETLSDFFNLVFPFYRADVLTNNPHSAVWICQQHKIKLS